MSRLGFPGLIGLALLVLGITVVARFHVWAEVDERAHYAYVQSVAEHGRLPEIDDLVSSDVLAITDGTFPRPSPTDPRTVGLAGRNYEAFQPPLYYVAAAPAFAIGGDHRHKVFAVRVFDLLLFALGAALLARLARRLAPAPRDTGLVLGAGLLVLAWPGVLVRGITVSNAALEFLVVPAFLLAAWETVEHRSLRRLALAAVLLGACLLTKLTLVFLIPVLLVAAAAVWEREHRRGTLVVGLLAVPALLIAPWLLANHARIGTFTADAAARTQQTPFLFPRGVPAWGVGDLPGHVWRLTQGALPQEWDGQLGVVWIGVAARAVVLALLLGAAVATVGATRHERMAVAFFALPSVAGVGVFCVTLLVSDWDLFFPRYLYSALPPLAIATAAALARHRPGVLRAGLGLGAVVLAALWVDMAGAFLFTDIGDSIGI